MRECVSRLRASLAALLASGLLAWSPSWAQQPYPTRVVKIVVPAAAGSTTDILGRLAADQLGKKWGKPVIVENIPGVGGSIGAASVARADPDGYTLLVAPPLSLSYAHLLFKDIKYEPDKFVPITLMATIPNVLVVREQLPVTTLKEFIDYAKANPGKLSYAAGGVGATSHLTAALLELEAGIKMVRVSYRSSQPALTDVVAGNVDLFFDTLATSVPLYRAHKVKLLAVADTKRAATVPEVPTFSEAGFPDFKSITWFGLVAPPGTPAELAEKINRDMRDSLKSQEVEDLLRKLSLEPGATSRAETAQFFAEEAERWSKVIKEIGLKPQ